MPYFTSLKSYCPRPIYLILQKGFVLKHKKTSPKMSTQVHKNLLEERAKIKLDTKELSEIVFGSPEELQTFLRFQEYMDNEPVQQHNPNFCALSRQEKMSEYIKKLHNYHAKFNYSSDDAFILAFAFYNDPLVTSLHQAMFLPCLKILTTEKQHDKW